MLTVLYLSIQALVFKQKINPEDVRLDNSKGYVAMEEDFNSPPPDSD